MNRAQLKNYLEELKIEIGNLEDKDPQVLSRLNELAGNIEEALDSPAESSKNDDLIDGIQGNIEHFEAEHPTITGILDRIMNALSSMGI
ncbi:MAG: DUF4404 family protein [Spirochaetales bacterium]|nr:DUF4404 family protein [Spirochaetales bacterium]